MKTHPCLLGTIATLAAPLFTIAAPIDRATITEVVNNVTVIEPASKKSGIAKLRQLFLAPNVLRTGADSRAEMIAEDQTVTRVGQNTLFSFEPNSREIDLQRGSILFQSPSGKGGGTIRTPAASAAVLGTTMIVTTTKNGGFKVLLLEGNGRVKGAGGATRNLGAGQMVYAMPGGKLSGVFEFRLSQQVAAAQLVKGFKKPLASSAKIQAAIDKQEKEIAGGDAVATNLLASGTPGIAIQVDVARDTVTDESDVKVAAVTAASSDAVVDAPLLDQQRVFLADGTPLEVPTNFSFFDHFGTPHAGDEAATRPALFLANNITFNTPSVDFGPYADRDLFQFVAINDITFEQSLDFGTFAGRELQLFAGGGFKAKPGTVVRADTGKLVFIGLGSSYPLTGEAPQGAEDISFGVPFTLSDFAALNTGGGLEFVGGNIDFAGIQLGAKAITIAAAGTIDLSGSSENAILRTVNSPFKNGAPSVPSGFSTLTARNLIGIAAKQDINIESTEFRSPTTAIATGGTLRMRQVQINDSTPIFIDSGGASPSGSQSFGVRSASLVARKLVDLRAVNFFTNDTFIQSQTIRLENVNFRQDSRVILESAAGLIAANPNTGAPVVPGRVNFIRRVDYGGQNANQFIRQNGAGTTQSGSGIFIRPIKK